MPPVLLVVGGLPATGKSTIATDVEGLVKPTWTAILEREYEPWRRRPLVVDSATTSPDSAAETIASRLARLKAEGYVHPTA